MMLNADIASHFAQVRASAFGLLRARFDAPYYLPHFDGERILFSGDRLTHYTDLHGLMGVIDAGGFWLSDHRFLNDSEEFENGRRLTLGLLDRLMKRIRYRLFRPVLEGVREHLATYQEDAYFIGSFSQAEDSLEQWRAYGRDGQGVALTFDLKAGRRWFTVLPLMTARRVIYDDRQKARILLMQIRKYALEYQRD